MGFDIDFDFQEGVDALKQQFKGPFDRFNKAPPTLLDEDFPEGFIITPIKDGVDQKKDEVQLNGNMIPHAPFTFGGKQRIVRNDYPGHSEPTVHVLGSMETDMVIRGRLYVKRIQRDLSQGPPRNFRAMAREQQKRLDLLRIQGLLCRFTLGTWQRFGFVEETTFDFKTAADITYQIKLFIIGFNAPTDCKALKISRTIPFDINKDLAAAASQFQTTQSEKLAAAQASFKRSFFDQMNAAIGEVAEAVGLVTGFVDNVLSVADDVKTTISRAQGLIKNAKAKISSYQRAVGAFNPVGNDFNPAPVGISTGYSNAEFITGSQFTVSATLLGLLARLSDQLSQFRELTPQRRHRISDGDTLQKLAVKFYGDADAWEEIYDHNNLGSTELVVGDILEIPRLEND